MKSFICKTSDIIECSFLYEWAFQNKNFIFRERYTLQLILTKVIRKLSTQR
jgi:hypothetical protein